MAHCMQCVSIHSHKSRISGGVTYPLGDIIRYGMSHYQAIKHTRNAVFVHVTNKKMCMVYMILSALETSLPMERRSLHLIQAPRPKTGVNKLMANG